MPQKNLEKILDSEATQGDLNDVISKGYENQEPIQLGYASIKKPGNEFLRALKFSGIGGIVGLAIAYGGVMLIEKNGSRLLDQLQKRKTEPIKTEFYNEILTLKKKHSIKNSWDIPEFEELSSKYVRRLNAARRPYNQLKTKIKSLSNHHNEYLIMGTLIGAATCALASQIGRSKRSHFRKNKE